MDGRDDGENNPADLATLALIVDIVPSLPSLLSPDNLRSKSSRSIEILWFSSANCWHVFAHSATSPFNLTTGFFVSLPFFIVELTSSRILLFARSFATPLDPLASVREEDTPIATGTVNS